MIIQSVEARNYGSFAELHYEPARGLIGVYGEGDPPSRSNGSGKSTAVEIILAALFGQFPRGTVSDIRSTVSSGDSIVDVTFQILNRVFRIRRVWGSSSVVSLYEDGKRSDGSVREMQTKIDALLRASFSVLVASSFFLQGESDRFTAATSAERLDYMREILSLEFWTKCYEVTSQRLKDAVIRVQESTTRKKAALERAGALEFQISEDRVQTLGEQCAAHQVSYNYWTSQLQTLRENEESVRSLSTVRDRLKKNQSILESVERDLQVARVAAATSTPSLMVYRCPRFLRERVSGLFQELRQQEGRIRGALQREASFLQRAFDATCPTCRQSVSEKTYRTLQAEAMSERVRYQAELDAVLKQIAECAVIDRKFAAAEITNAQALATLEEFLRLQEVGNKIPILETHAQALRELVQKDTTAVELASSISLSELLVSIREAEKKQDEEKRLVQGLTTEIDQIAVYQQMYATEMRSAETENQNLQQLSRQSAILTELKKIFSRTGVSFFVVQQIVERELQPLSNQVLEQLRTSYHIEFQLKTSSDKNTLDILVREGEALRKYETFSGAEKELLNFSIRMALSRLLRQRGFAAPIQFVVLDEIFGELDAYNREIMERVLTMLKQEFHQLFVISHVPLNLPFDQVIKVKRVGKLSTIVGGNI